MYQNDHNSIVGESFFVQNLPDIPADDPGQRKTCPLQRRNIKECGHSFSNGSAAIWAANILSTPPTTALRICSCFRYYCDYALQRHVLAVAILLWDLPPVHQQSNMDCREKGEGGWNRKQCSVAFSRSTNKIVGFSYQERFEELRLPSDKDDELPLIGSSYQKF